MRFSAVSPSTSTVMQAPEKIQFFCFVHSDFYFKFLSKKSIHQEKKTTETLECFFTRGMELGGRGIRILLSKGVEWTVVNKKVGKKARQKNERIKVSGK